MFHTELAEFGLVYIFIKSFKFRNRNANVTANSFRPQIQNSKHIQQISEPPLDNLKLI